MTEEISDNRFRVSLGRALCAFAAFGAVFVSTRAFSPELRAWCALPAGIIAIVFILREDDSIFTLAAAVVGGFLIALPMLAYGDRETAFIYAVLFGGASYFFASKLQKPFRASPGKVLSSLAIFGTVYASVRWLSPDFELVAFTPATAIAFAALFWTNETILCLSGTAFGALIAGVFFSSFFGPLHASPTAIFPMTFGALIGGASGSWLARKIQG